MSVPKTEFCILSRARFIYLFFIFPIVHIIANKKYLLQREIVMNMKNNKYRCFSYYIFTEIILCKMTSKHLKMF